MFQRVTNAISGASGGRYAALDQLGSGDISGEGIRYNVPMRLIVIVMCVVQAIKMTVFSCCGG